jgi:hypothetical protein
MKINKKQLIEQLRYLADNDPNQLKEILNESFNEKNSTLMDAAVEYLNSNEIKKQQIKKIREESFKRFDKVYKALS